MKSFLIFIFFISFKLITIKALEEEDKIINLDINGNLPDPNDPDIFYIPILLTNDIHGSFYPKKILLPSGGTYTIGGLEYLGKYYSILSKTWGNRLLYFDSGDQFQGGIEGFISKGKIMMDFFNKLNLKNSVIGNHEFDYGIDFLKNYMNMSNFEWIIDNVKNTTTGKYMTFPHQNQSKIIEVEGIKIGIIGLATVETPSSTRTEMPDLQFEDYKKIVEDHSAKLKKDGANAIIVLAHLGLYCRNDPNEIKLEYKLRDHSTTQSECRKTDEAYILLKKLNNDVLDLFLAGHRHDVSHHWINDIPIMGNDRNGKYAQIAYLPFNKEKKLIKEKIVLEGPLPICEKLFENKKLCDLSVVTESDEKKFGKLLKYKFHNEIIDKEENITKIGNDYINIFNEYDKDYLTFTYDHFETSKTHENAMGNFYTDFLRKISGVDISIVNPGSFRIPLYRGNITNATIYSFDPFGTNLVKFYAYGWEIKKMIAILQKGSKGYYPFSGLKIVIEEKSKKLISIKLYDGFQEEELNEEKEYSLISNEFCFPLNPNSIGGDDFKKVYQWYRPRSGSYVKVGNYNNTRDIFIEYLRNIKLLKADKYVNSEDQRMRIIKNAASKNF